MDYASTARTDIESVHVPLVVVRTFDILRIERFDGVLRCSSSFVLVPPIRSSRFRVSYLFFLSHLVVVVQMRYSPLLPYQVKLIQQTGKDYLEIV